MPNVETKAKELSEPLSRYLIGKAGTFAPVSPVLKWAGGKTQLIEQMAPYFPSEVNQYHEPFLGGGAVFFHLAPSLGRTALISDAVPDLINFYRVLRDETREFIAEIHELSDRYASAPYKEKEKLFYWYRSLDRNGEFKNLRPIRKAIRFYFLNKTAFNGLYRTNMKGQFNTPWGKYKNPALFAPEDLRAAADVLNLFAKKIEVADFEVVLDKAIAGDFVYFDPPYVPVSETASFTSYSKDGFNMKDQERLVAVCRELETKNVKFMLSNSDVPFVRKNYGQFKVIVIQARRNINSNGNKRGLVNELLVTNY